MFNFLGVGHAHVDVGVIHEVDILGPFPDTPSHSKRAAQNGKRVRSDHDHAEAE